MWHVDEGTLHAFLDEAERPGCGALAESDRARVEQHVRECTACAAALQAEAALRQRAAAVLGAASPSGVAVPAFEQISRPAAPRRKRTVARLAWAASITAAIGAGWFGSALWRSGPSPTGTKELSLPAAASPALPPVGDMARGEAGTDAAATREEGPAIVPERSLDAPVSSDGAVMGNIGRVAAEGGAAGAGAVAPAAPAVPPPSVLAGAPQSAPPVALEGVVVTGAAAAETRVVEQSKAVDRQRQRSEAASVPLNALREDAVARRSAVQGYPGDADVVWRRITEAEASGLLGRPMLRVPDAGVDSVVVSADGRVRSWQQAPEGAVELVQWRDGQLPAPQLQLGTARDGGQYVASMSVGLRVVVKAPPGVQPLPLLARVLGGARHPD